MKGTYKVLYVPFLGIIVVLIKFVSNYNVYMLE